MVKKLFKHEFLAYARIMSVILVILLTVATAGRVIQFFENDSIPYSIVSTLSFITYGFSLVAAAIFSFAFAVVRFYRNLFTAEGYLSFTLPVTSSQHIWVKSLTALCFEVITWIVMILSLCIITSGEMLKEIYLALAYIFDKLYAFAGFHTVLFVVEALAAILVAALCSMLLYYTFISIGQLFKKNRILAAVGAYFVYYIISQVVSSVFSISFSMLLPLDVSEKIGRFVALHPLATAHTILCGSMLLNAVFVLIFFSVIRAIITKKLNLE